MAGSTTYPTSLDAYVDHSLGDAYVGQAHADQHNNEQAALLAIEAKLGLTSQGYNPIKALIRADTTRTFTSDTNLQAIFTTPTTGALTCTVGTYLFDGLIYITTMSATSGNGLIDILGAGTATTGAWVWSAIGIDATDPTAAAAMTGSFAVTKVSVASIVTAATGTGMAVAVKGMFEVSVAGTVIPSFQHVTAAASVVSVGSYIAIERVSTSVALTSVGNWA